MYTNKQIFSKKDQRQRYRQSESRKDNFKQTLTDTENNSFAGDLTIKLNGPWKVAVRLSNVKRKQYIP